jgi:hypothetical protein
MKTIWCLLILLGLSTTAAMAQDNPLYVGIGGGMDAPIQNWQSAYSLGGGGKAFVGYNLDATWSVQLDIDNFYFSGTSPLGKISDTSLRFLPEIKYSIPAGDSLKFYLLVGTGLDCDFVSGASQTNWDVDGGLGVEIPLCAKTSLFLEGKWNLLVSDGPNGTVTGQDIPLVLGVRAGL